MSYHKLTQYDMKLLVIVITFKMLNGSNISKDERKLALIMGNNLQFETIKSSLQRIFTK